MGNNITVEISTASTVEMVTRQRRYAHKSSARVAMEIWRDGDTYRCAWDSNRGLGWRKRHVSIAYRTEAEAMALADRMWTKCLSWLGKVEPVSYSARSLLEAVR